METANQTQMTGIILKLLKARGFNRSRFNHKLRLMNYKLSNHHHMEFTTRNNKIITNFHEQPYHPMNYNAYFDAFLSTTFSKYEGIFSPKK